MSNTKTQLELGTSDDVTLVDAAKQGDMAAFEQLVKRHTAMIFRVAMHIMACREDAEVVVQDAFFKAFQHLQDFEGRARFSTWLTRIAVNAALTRLRYLHRATTVSIDQEADEGGTLANSMTSAAERDVALTRLIAKASPRSDIRGSSDYRLAMLLVMSRRSLRIATDRLNGTGAAK